jgi:hypothetical protein
MVKPFRNPSLRLLQPVEVFYFLGQGISLNESLTTYGLCVDFKGRSYQDTIGVTIGVVCSGCSEDATLFTKLKLNGRNISFC